MKKLLSAVLIITLLLTLTACGPGGGEPLNSSDASVTSNDIPTETLPMTSEGLISSDSEPVTVPDETSGDVSEPEISVTSEDEPAVTTVSDMPTADATTDSAATTAVTTTTAKTTQTAAAATTTADPDDDDGFEEEDIGWGEVIENVDEWLQSMGFSTGDSVNANE